MRRRTTPRGHGEDVAVVAMAVARRREEDEEDDGRRKKGVKLSNIEARHGQNVQSVKRRNCHSME